MLSVLFLLPALSLIVNGLIWKHSNTISLIDEIQKSILSLLSTDLQDNHGDKAAFLAHCRHEYANNQSTLSKIDEFELNYHSEQAIFWYTRHTFIHLIINKALCSEDPQMIDPCQVFIRDLHHIPFFLHRIKYRRDIVQPRQICYRGMILSKKDITKLIVGNLITFKSFTSASLSREVAMMFAGNALIEIEIHNRTGLYDVFNQVSDLSNFKDEEEILFSIGNVFRVEQVQWCPKKSIWEIKLILQKHIKYRSNFGVKSTNNLKPKLIVRVWQSLIKSLINIFKS